MVLAAARFLFCATLRRPEVVAGIRRARTQPTVPIILSGNEMAQLLASLRSVTYRAMAATLYGTGLRVSEMCALRIEDIDSKRMQLRIPQGKTGQRYARLTPAVLRELRDYYRQRRPSLGVRICSPVVAQAGLSRALRSPRPWRRSRKSSGCANGSIRTYCVMRSPCTCLSSAPTYVRFSFCSGTAACAAPSATFS